jgi:Type II secretion system protein B
VNKNLKFSLLISLAAAAGNTFAQPAQKSDDKSTQPVRSVFSMPASPNDGRDPFYPDSSRPYQGIAPAHVVEITTLTVHGFSGTPDNRMVIINNHTFGVGDEGDVLTPGGRVHVRCIEINPNGVVVEANGQRRELIFSTH